MVQVDCLRRRRSTATAEVARVDITTVFAESKTRAHGHERHFAYNTYSSESADGDGPGLTHIRSFWRLVLEILALALSSYYFRGLYARCVRRIRVTIFGSAVTWAFYHRQTRGYTEN